MTVNVTKLGPGLLTIGEVGTPVDISCQVSAMRIAWEKNKDDDIPTLCGDTAPGDLTYTATLTGTVFQDFGNPDGLGVLSWEQKGTTVPFVFVPSNVWAQQATGQVTIDPLDFGGDEVKASMVADLEWDIVGEPVLSAYVPPTQADDDALVTA